MARGRWTALAALGISLLAFAPACSDTANVSEVWMSIDDDGARRRSVFFTDSAGITCVAQVGVGRRDVTFELLIRRIGEQLPGAGKVEPTNKVIAAQEFHPEPTPEGPTTIALTMQPTTIGSDGQPTEDSEAPFVAGRYVCEVSVDGTTQKHADFDVEYAPCPAVVIQQGVRCAGFYEIGTECPASGATGDPEPTCACTDRGWECAQ